MPAVPRPMTRNSMMRPTARFEPPKPDALKFDPLKTAAAFRAKEAVAAATAEATRPRTNRFPLLAASVALAAASGAVLGSLAMAGVAKFSPRDHSWQRHRQHQKHPSPLHPPPLC